MERGILEKITIGRTTLDRTKFNLPYLIAEAGVNHEGRVDLAKQMVEEVAKAGGNAIKFQAYKAETLASKYSPAYWDISREASLSQYELFKKHDQFGKLEFEEIADYAKTYKIDFLATPFDNESTDFLEQIVVAYKIASADITNKPFLEYVARKGKPIILSTGASTVFEIWRAIEWIKESSNNQIVLLHCILNYPTKYEDANLGMIVNMKNLFPYVIGYSDHTMPQRANSVLITAWLLGSQVIEKHYTWDKHLDGNDHYHSIDFNDLNLLTSELKFINTTIGSFEKRFISTENNSRKFARRSLVANQRIPKGAIISENMLISKRPGIGIPPYLIDMIIGHVATRDIDKDEILSFDLVSIGDSP